jgi:hypothetical protein
VTGGWRGVALLLVAAFATAPVAPLEAQAGRARRDLPEGRPAMEQRVRQGMWRVARERIGLTDEQMARLARSSERFDARRRSLVQEERRQRQLLRTQILAGADANQEQVSAALDRLLVLQRERVDVQIAEQRDFATFMTPIQRARYLALQEQVRRRLETLRGRRDSSRAPVAGELSDGG